MYSLGVDAICAMVLLDIIDLYTRNCKELVDTGPREAILLMLQPVKGESVTRSDRSHREVV